MDKIGSHNEMMSLFQEFGRSSFSTDLYSYVSDVAKYMGIKRPTKEQREKIKEAVLEGCRRRIWIKSSGAYSTGNIRYIEQYEDLQYKYFVRQLTFTEIEDAEILMKFSDYFGVTIEMARSHKDLIVGKVRGIVTSEL